MLEVNTIESKFTWRGPKWDGRGRIFKRLDKTICNVPWQIEYQEGIAKVLHRIESDHHPNVVLLDGVPIHVVVDQSALKQLGAHTHGLQNSSKADGTKTQT